MTLVVHCTRAQDVSNKQHFTSSIHFNHHIFQVIHHSPVPHPQVTAQKYGLDDISYSSFELQYGFKHRFCAGDILHSVFTALTSPTLDTEGAFMLAQDTLNRSNEKLIRSGIEQSKSFCRALLNQVQAFIDMKQVVCTGPFVYAVIQVP